MLSTAQKPRNKVLAVYRDSFSLGSPQIEAWEPGQNIEQIIDRMKCLPPNFRTGGGVVMINGTEVPAVRWRYVKPKAHSAEKPVAVTFHMPPKGGRGGGKRIFSIIAALALSVATAGIAAFGIPGIVAGGTLGAKLLAAGVGLVGSLVVSALSSTPVTNNTAANADGGGAALEPASVNGNLLQQNAPIPHVIGTRDVYPPFLSEPTIELIGQDEYVDALYGLSGAHSATNHRIGKASIDETNFDADLRLHYFDGRPESEPIDYPQRYSRTFTLGNEMSVQGVSPTDANVYVGPLPVWHAMSTADSPHEAWLQLLSVGLIRQADTSQFLRLPFRIRARRRGDADWRYFPEIHYMDKTQVQRRLQFKFLFGSAFIGTPPAVQIGARGFIEARKLVPAQNVAPIGADWESDAYFSSGAGDDIYGVGTNATTNVLNTVLEPDQVTFYLDQASWPAGIYDFEIKRGTVFRDNLFTTATYVYNGNIYDFYGQQTAGTMPLSRDGILDRVNLTRFVSVKNEPPIDQKNLTLIYIRARNRTVDNYSFTASGYTRDWDGSGWNNLTTTSNPVPHYRDILSGSLNYDPLPDQLHDNDTLLEWRQACIDNNYRCDMVCENLSVQETLRIVAACGYASPYQSEVWGVVRDYDRSAEAPVQIFSSRTINDFKWRKAFQRMPAGLRVNFKDDQYQYTGKQIVVYRAGASESDARTEQVTYEGLVLREDCIKRANFDLKQGENRSTIYSWNSPIENIVARRGSLIGLNHDQTQQHYGSGRIDFVDIDADGNISGIVLDNVIKVYNNASFMDIPDILAVEDVLETGLQTSIAIRRTNGVTSDHPLSNATGETDTLVFETPVADLDGVQSPFDNSMPKQIDPGCLVIVGILGKVYKRLLVNDILPGKDLTATITALDEAPQIWQEAA
jgi:hypothetical protein